jgi:hypothetical protein
MNQEFIDLLRAVAEGYPAVQVPNGPPEVPWILNAVEQAAIGELPPYIGMGNPDADILLVGCEQALEPMIDAQIIWHELVLNHAHWHDIVVNHHRTPSHDPTLLLRQPPFAGFSPYNPLLWPATWQKVVAARGNHTYCGMWKAVNCGAGNADVNGLGRLEPDAAKNWQWHLFDKVFLTELNVRVAKRSADAQFNGLEGPRYDFMSGIGASFYQRFKTVVIYAGGNPRYIGTPRSARRLSLITLFNPNLQLAHRHVHTFNVMIHPPGAAHGPIPYTSLSVEEYTNGNGRRLLIAPHLSRENGKRAALAVQHLLCNPIGVGTAVALGFDPVNQG